MKNRQGIVVALQDHDVRSGTPENFAINTDTQTLNLRVDDISPNLGVINTNFKNNGAVPSTNVLLFRKVLDPTYAQFFYIAFNQTQSSKLLSSQYGFEFDLDVFGDRQFKVTKVDNVVELRYIVSPGYVPVLPADDLTGFIFQFQFAFYVNPAV